MTSRRAPRIVVVGLLVLMVVLAATLGLRLLTPSPSTSSVATSSSALTSSSAWSTWSTSSSWAAPPGAAPPGDAPLSGHLGRLGEADGAVPDGTTVFDDGVAGVANLDPALLDALRDAAEDAAEDGVELHVNSGWRSAAYQDRLLREAVAEYGSEEEAARWVATAETSAHVSGDAVDIGPPEAASWVADHGDDHGLCRIYDNEPWHYELRPEAIDQGCPDRYADPTEDPRMQR